MVSSINCIKIKSKQIGDFVRDKKIVAEIKAAFGFIAKVVYARPIDLNYSLYDRVEDLIWFSQATTDNNALNDSSFGVTKMTNNIAGLDIGIAKRNGRYYLYCNEDCEIYCYVIQGSFPIIIPVESDTSDEFEIVKSANKGRFGIKPTSGLINIPKSFVTTYDNLSYINISENGDKCDWQNIALSIYYKSGYMKISPSDSSDSIVVLYNREGFSSMTLLSFRKFKYNGNIIFRVYAKLMSSKPGNSFLPTIYKDNINHTIYIKCDEYTRITNLNTPFEIENAVDIESLEKLDIEVDYTKSGLYSEAPLSPTVGFSYFCTDRQTIENQSPGIMIFHKGGGVWVDALGRIIE